eukprot:5881869-Prymnesium_polylepis.1
MSALVRGACMPVDAYTARGSLPMARAGLSPLCQGNGWVFKKDNTLARAPLHDEGARKPCAL